MFQGLSIKSKKTSKNTQSKKANKKKTASLESTRSTSLSESFSKRFDNLGVNDNSGSNSYSNAKASKSYERTLARIIESHREILSELKVIKDKVRRIENHLNDLEQKIDNGFNITNDKAFKELLQKIRSLRDSNAPPETIAYAIAICQTMLNPKNKIIMMSDHIVKKLIAINLNKLKYHEHFSILSSEDEASQEDRNKSDDNDSENDNTKQGCKCKNNSNYFDKVNKRPRVKLVDLDPKEVQEAKNDPDEDVNKEKDTNDYEKNNDE
ncbi:hypothetical protein F8M41_010135 [Gigaspora margarita]|uniref:Uncharacterized protein n=1 Tax=Gigaspora margarita TaxID=4874 RepID=A0A8H3X147_GIGMA|nr:hypothetical protein F8M41_010135 [Gigaspora margarita]